MKGLLIFAGIMLSGLAIVACVLGAWIPESRLGVRDMIAVLLAIGLLLLACCMV